MFKFITDLFAKKPRLIEDRIGFSVLNKTAASLAIKHKIVKEVKCINNCGVKGYVLMTRGNYTKLFVYFGG